MGEYLAAPALLDEPAVQQSFLSYFNTIVVSPGDGACLSWSSLAQRRRYGGTEVEVREEGSGY